MSVASSSPTSTETIGTQPAEDAQPEPVSAGHEPADVRVERGAGAGRTPATSRMSRTAQTASRYGGGTGPPKMSVFDRSFSTSIAPASRPTNPPRHENAFDSEPTTSVLS